jgi:hypothetical protein
LPPKKEKNNLGENQKKFSKEIVMRSFYFLIMPVLLTGCFGMAAKGEYDVATDQRSVE